VNSSNSFLPRSGVHTLRRMPAAAGGFAAATALVGIALFVLLGVAAATIARGNAKARLFHEIKEEMVAQSDLILNTLLLCRTIYPAGDNGTGAHRQYPATPADGTVAALTCPGQGAVSLWSGDARAMAPRRLPGFSAWRYVNDAASVRILTTVTAASTAYYQDLLDAVVAKVGPAQAVRSGDTLTITLIQ
jgi:hypothetical protein